MKNNSTIICSVLATMSRCQFLPEFCQFYLARTGDNIGKWLMYSHTLVECEPYFIGSHVMDGAVNSGKLIEVLWLSTIYERYGMIFSANCDARQIRTTGEKSSGTISHKFNTNPGLGKSLTLLYTYIVRLGGSLTSIKVYDNVRKDRHQKISHNITSGVRARWNSYHIETSRAPANQSDLEIFLILIICPTGIDSYFYKYHRQNIGVVLPSIIYWDVYREYKSVIHTLKKYSKFFQGVVVMFHN